MSAKQSKSHAGDAREALEAFFEAYKEEQGAIASARKARQEEAQHFIPQGYQALQDLVETFQRHGRNADVSQDDDKEWASITVSRNGTKEFEYRVVVNVDSERAYPYFERTTWEPDEKRPSYHPTRGQFREGSQDYTVHDVSREEIAHSVVREYAALMKAKLPR